MSTANSTAIVLPDLRLSPPRRSLRPRRPDAPWRTCRQRFGLTSKAGSLLAKMEKHNGDPLLHDATRLDDLGINRTQSHRWQRIAALPAEDFERHLRETAGLPGYLDDAIRRTLRER